MDDDTLVCRCEEVTVGEIRQAIREGAVDVTGVKRRTRAGMGLCQGRTCERLVMRILSQELGRPMSEFEPDTVRPPVMPVTFESLAGGADVE
ncbi:MAG: (2Fe-2S)-binding protein [Candidatus Bipolaricaulota bacterium]|nr:(2Fe-2S)-binding protein [Candidatus Bipolaricaulota bacterium]